MAGLIVLLVYVAIGAAVLWGIVMLYIRSVISRKFYRCPHCKETVRVELMQAKFCNVCGAPLNVEEDEDAPA